MELFLKGLAKLQLRIEDWVLVRWRKARSARP
jgi:hypothetical protein